MKNNHVVLLVCIFATILIGLYCYAGEVRIVEGLIEDVKGNNIEVRGNYYDISGVPLINSSGENLKKEKVKIGTKIEIFFEDDKITSVLIYDEYMVE